MGENKSWLYRHSDFDLTYLTHASDGAERYPGGSQSFGVGLWWNAKTGEFNTFAPGQPVHRRGRTDGPG